MGVAIRTYLEMKADESNETRDIASISRLYFPQTRAFLEDVEIFGAFFSALVEGIKTLDQSEQEIKGAWTKAHAYLEGLV